MTESTLVHIDMARHIPGASDALFWAQYLEEDEGEPMFGFAPAEEALLDALIKGGPGSGNFSATHIGRPGQRGGSGDDGIPNASAQPGNAPQGRKLAAGALTPTRRGNDAQRPAGASTVAPSASGRGVGGRVPVDFRDPRQVSQAVTGFLQASPTFAAALKTKGPLSPKFLATPQGQAPGSQHLPTLMKELGIAANKPTVKPLKLGAKSLFFPTITSDAELNALLFKVPPDPAHSTGFWVPGKAAGGGAHGKLKEGAKVADGKKVERERKKEEAKVKPLMVNALLMAGLTGDYREANVLQLHYQLVGNLGTFALLMGYPTLNFGMQTGTVVFDRAELEVDPTLVPREPVGAGQARLKRRGVGKLIKGNA